MDLYYLAAPYSNALDKEVLMSHLCRVDAFLMQEGMYTLSPLLKHYIVHHADLPGDWEYWKEYAYLTMRACTKMIVVMFDGWKESTGVTHEIAHYQEIGKEILYFDPLTYSFVENPV